jgi:hypothetical protein
MVLHLILEIIVGDDTQISVQWGSVGKLCIRQRPAPECAASQ